MTMLYAGLVLAAIAALGFLLKKHQWPVVPFQKDETDDGWELFWDESGDQSVAVRISFVAYGAENEAVALGAYDAGTPAASALTLHQLFLGLMGQFYPRLFAEHGTDTASHAAEIRAVLSEILPQFLRASAHASLRLELDSLYSVSVDVDCISRQAFDDMHGPRRSFSDD